LTPKIINKDVANKAKPGQANNIAKAAPATNIKNNGVSTTSLETSPTPENKNINDKENLRSKIKITPISL
jgi:hypothetical protein